MSLFLSKVHYMLFDRILLFENITDEICEAFNVSSPSHITKPLEEAIDTSDIHGSLNQHIFSAESRLASLMADIDLNNKDNLSKIIDIYEKHGRLAAESITYDITTAEEAYRAVSMLMLEGMPCDRVTEHITIGPDLVSWRTVECLHKPHWDEEGIDVEYFYTFRRAWLAALISSLNNDLTYSYSDDVNHIVRRK